MFDAIFVPPRVHEAVGGLVLLMTLLSLLWFAWRAFKNRAPGTAGNVLLMITQAVLMVQALIGVKLLDQGLHVMQIYVHYIGGLAPLAFFLVWYWLPERSRQGRWLGTVLTSGVFLFAIMTFFIGQSYVASGSGMGA
ncbi:MAG TPA: hypothetical protein VK092_01355 [Deinococcales bacterium]|nr:hypothetical protein [Deinococcales bacterium]